MKMKIRTPKPKRERATPKAAKILEALNKGMLPKEIKDKFGVSYSYIYMLKAKMAHRDDTLDLTSDMKLKTVLVDGHIKPEALPGEFIETNSVSEPNNVNAILNERGKRYGSFMDHAAISQNLKTVAFAFASDRGKTFAADQYEALDMIFHKIGRILNGDPNYADSWIDIAGYAKLVADRLEGKVR